MQTFRPLNKLSTLECFDLPVVDELGVDLEGPDEASEHFNGPGVTEDVFDISHIHAELIAESLFDIKWNLAQNAMNLRDSLICHCNLGQVRVLEEAIVWLLILDTQSHCAIHVGLIASSLWQDFLAAREHINVASIFELDSTLDVLRASNIFDFHTGTLVLFSLD